jgi:hypothetical protein
VELGSCTVRFLVRAESDYARSDAAPGAGDDAVPLAVWAFRAADQFEPEAPEVELDVGGPDAVVSRGEGSGVEPAVALVADLLVDGAAHTGPSIDGAIARTRRLLDEGNLRWPVDVVDAIADQLAAYRSRSVRYAADQLAFLLAEVVARHRCVAGGRASPRSQVLGSEEAEETALRQLRLTGIGCRVTGDSESRTARVFLVHAEAAMVLVVDRRWEMGEGESPVGADLAGRRLAGSTLAVLAAGNVATDSARRSARRAVRIGTNRVARTTVAPSGGDWGHLPQTLVVRDLDALSSTLAALPSRLVRPRVAADLARIVEIGEMLDVRYERGAQRLSARIQAAGGGTATVSAVHRAVTPAALAAALAGEVGLPRFVSGVVHRSRGDVVVEPLAVVAGDTVVVPDVAPGEGAGALAPGGLAPQDPLVQAVDEALQVSADVAHRGLRHLTPTFHDRVGDAAARLQAVGLRRAAEAMAQLGSAVAAGADDGLTAAWASAHIRLSGPSNRRARI